MYKADITFDSSFGEGIQAQTSERLRNTIDPASLLAYDRARKDLAVSKT